MNPPVASCMYPKTYGYSHQRFPFSPKFLFHRRAVFQKHFPGRPFFPAYPDKDILGIVVKKQEHHTRRQYKYHCPEFILEFHETAFPFSIFHCPQFFHNFHFSLPFPAFAFPIFHPASLLFFRGFTRYTEFPAQHPVPNPIFS